MQLSSTRQLHDTSGAAIRHHLIQFRHRTVHLLVVGVADRSRGNPQPQEQIDRTSIVWVRGLPWAGLTGGVERVNAWGRV